jgi:hypothetical protein
MRKSNFAPRLQPPLLDEARKLAEAEGVAPQSHQRGSCGKGLSLSVQRATLRSVLPRRHS